MGDVFTEKDKNSYWSIVVDLDGFFEIKFLIQKKKKKKNSDSSKKFTAIVIFLI